MTMLTRQAFGAAATYMELNARLLERRRFEFLFRGGSAHTVLDALRGYQNGDGGFGNGLEPDLRGGTSQPQPAEQALWVLDEVDGFGDAMVARLCAWLAATSADGGLPFVLSNVKDDPRAWWWQPDEGPDGKTVSSINPTGPVVGLLHANRIQHDWLSGATEFCWRVIAETGQPTDYDCLATLAFLERAPDRQRAETEFDRLSQVILSRVALDPATTGHVHFPLDFAPRPDSMARRLFADSDIQRNLDHVIRRQNSDGGWTPNFEMWTPAVVAEWGGFLTLNNLKTLRAYGRIAAVAVS